jgi:Ca-activated chloride channel family protein
LNIGLVLDTSGSMKAPQKIDYVKEAATTLVRYLGARDTLSIVTYDTEARVLLPAAPFAGRTTLLHVLESLEADGRTNLSDGVETGLRQIRPYVRADVTSRLILLTDGLANEGITGSEGLARLATEVRRAGASLSTIGLGSSFDSALLRRMAESGGGRYHYAALADELPTILAREVEGLLAQSMGEITIDLELTPDAGLQSTFGYPFDAEGSRYVIPIGSLSEGSSRTLVVELVGRCAHTQSARWGPPPFATATE